MSDVFHFKKAVVIDLGPVTAKWIKVQLTNSEEAFFYPDDDNTVRVKDLKPGLQVVHRELRKCTKTGQTRWQTTAHAFDLQPEQTKKYLSEAVPEPVVSECVISTEKTDEEVSFMNSYDPIAVRIKLDSRESYWLRQLISKAPYSSNKIGASKMISEIVSEAKATDLMEKYYKIKGENGA